MTTRKERRHLTQKYIKKQATLWNLAGTYQDFEVEPHYFHKKSSLGCKVPGCKLCGNPRRIRGERTLQELKGDNWKNEYQNDL